MIVLLARMVVDNVLIATNIAVTPAPLVSCFTTIPVLKNIVEQIHVMEDTKKKVEMTVIPVENYKYTMKQQGYVIALSGLIKTRIICAKIVLMAVINAQAVINMTAIYVQKIMYIIMSQVL